MSHRLIISPLRSTCRLIDRSRIISNVSGRNLSIEAKKISSDAVSLFNDAVQPENLVKVIPRLEYLNQMNFERRGKRQSSSKSKKYAVLIPFCLDADGDASILYTLRSRQLRRSGNQLSFPGGLQDPSDNDDVIETALRETEEEIALPRDKVNVIGTLPALTFFLNADTIHPILSLVNLQDVSLHPSPDEVESIHLAKLKDLVIDERWRYTRWKLGWALPCYRDAIFNDRAVPRLWGLTAMLTHLLLRAMFPSTHKFHFDLMEAPYVPDNKRLK